jgi:hypothetical protein
VPGRRERATPPADTGALGHAPTQPKPWGAASGHGENLAAYLP